MEQIQDISPEQKNRKTVFVIILNLLQVTPIHLKLTRLRFLKNWYIVHKGKRYGILRCLGIYITKARSVQRVVIMA